jgi:hypothetical protein
MCQSWRADWIPTMPGRINRPEEAEAMQGSNDAMGIGPIHHLEPGPKVGPEAKQPREITENELHAEEWF